MNRNVILLSLCQALLVTGNILLVAVNALIGRELAPSAALITLPVAFQFVGLMAATIPASLIMGRIGRRNGFYLGNSIGIAGALVCLLALQQASFWLFSVGTLLLGVGIGFGTLYRFAAVDACEPEQHSRAISLVMAGGVLAAVLGPNLAVYSRQWFDTQPFIGAFAGLLGLYVLALVLLSRIHFNPAPADALAGSQRPMREILAQPAFISAVVAGMVSYAVMVLLMTATPLAMARCGYSFGSAAQVIEWHVLGMFVPSFFTGRLLGRFGVRPMMQLGALLMLLCTAINLHGTSEWHFMLALLLLGVGWNFMFIGATQLVTRCYRPAEKAKSQAANEFLVFSMTTLAALSTGWLESSVGWATMNVLMVPVLLWAMAVIWWFRAEPQADAAAA
ncbi:MFS transporter [Marinobacterium arenosum]|uniref:MFS transporter n=1 Tax=Marinobacterium arenosum TaxID=2862496 RepID=UPI001C96D3D1|nr:MFS transporter [Marinobacterium arenosum]MBY4677778.1 MFS transporter [Marinobacterium arenosum]